MCDNVAYLKNARSYVVSKAILQTLPECVEYDEGNPLGSKQCSQSVI